jgi:hypothetical protein
MSWSQTYMDSSLFLMYEGGTRGSLGIRSVYLNLIYCKSENIVNYIISCNLYFKTLWLPKTTKKIQNSRAQSSLANPQPCRESFFTRAFDPWWMSSHRCHECQAHPKSLHTLCPSSPHPTPQSMIAHPHLLVRATGKRTLPNLVTSGGSY